MRLFPCSTPHLFLLGALIFGALPAQANIYDDAGKLLKDGQAEAAFRLLEPLEFEQAGNPDFDYLLGVAALEAGEPGKATLAFERVLAMAPNHAGARLDMARAYYVLADYPRARAEFEALGKLNPPPAARMVIDRYLSAIDARQTSGHLRAKGYIEAGLGHDSNPSYAPEQNTVPIGPFISATLDQDSARKSANYGTLGFGGNLEKPLGNQWAAYAAVDGRIRNYSQRIQYDFGNVDLRGGLQHTDGPHQVRFGLGGNYYHQDVVGRRYVWSVNTDYRYALAKDAELSAYGQLSKVRYQERALQAQDTNQWLLGAGWLQLINNDPRSAVFANTFLIGENAMGERPDGDKYGVGARGGVSLPVSPDIDCFVILAAQYGRYENTTSVLRTSAYRRRDIQYDGTLGLNWRIDSNWSLRPSISYTRNNSNVPIYAWDRTDASLMLRRDFQ